MSVTKVSSAMQDAMVVADLPAGSTVQVVNVTSGAVATTTTPFNTDDTIPQKTEGGEFMTLAITPTNSSNKLLIQVRVVGAYSTGSSNTCALFQDTTANALASTQHYQATTNTTTALGLNHYMVAGTTSETTFKVRGGGNGGSNTFTFNGISAGRIHGGVHSSSITITEIKV